MTLTLQEKLDNAHNPRRTIVFLIPGAHPPLLASIRPTLEHMQDLVGGLIEIVPNPWPNHPRLSLCVHEEGIINDELPNYATYFLLHETEYQGVPIRGRTFVFASKATTDGYDLVDLNEEEVTFLYDTLAPKVDRVTLLAPPSERN